MKTVAALAAVKSGCRLAGRRNARIREKLINRGLVWAHRDIDRNYYIGLTFAGEAALTSEGRTK